jgi:hypothetical protein
MKLHREVLSEAQERVLPRLGAFATSRGFYLGGGTAVAVYMGHRRSVDFDWFTDGKLEDPLVLAEVARAEGLNLQGVQVAPGTLHAVLEGVRVSFFEYPYPRIGEAVAWADYAIDLASLDDLACMKLAAVAQRGSRKDFVDLHTIALAHRPFEELLDLYKRKYPAGDIAPVLIGLTYFDDAEDEPMPLMLSDTSWDEIKQQMQAWVSDLAG